MLYNRIENYIGFDIRYLINRKLNKKINPEEILDIVEIIDTKLDNIRYNRIDCKKYLKNLIKKIKIIVSRNRENIQDFDIIRIPYPQSLSNDMYHLFRRELYNIRGLTLISNYHFRNGSTYSAHSI